MKTHGKTSVSEFLGDFVVYRNLKPADERLLELDAIRDRVGLPEGRTPRKSEPEYARVIVHLLRQARTLEAPGVRVERLIYVGDTRLNDGTAFANICQAGQWPGLAFIGTETKEPDRAEVVGVRPSESSEELPTQVSEVEPAESAENAAPLLYLANRWAALPDFDRFCGNRDFPIDAATAVVVDLDKTALGARGRNAHVIDQARVLAVRHTVADLLRDAFNPAAFQTAYDELNEPEFHTFTADNQDYLAYICLILGSGLYNLDAVVSSVRNGSLTTFEEFITEVDQYARGMTPDLGAIHSDIYANVRAGDPTPFKAFRFNEYLTTVARMGQMDDNASVETLLANEILITQEVREMALEWRERGSLLFGLSDKPDEASVPSQDLAAQGYRAIHQAVTHAVGA